MTTARHPIDYPLFLTIFALVIFGLVMISSVSVFESYNLTKSLSIKDPTHYPEPTNSFYLLRSLWHTLFAMAAWLVSMFIPLKFWKKSAPLLFFGGVVLLLLLFTRLGVTLNGATGWLDIPGVPSIQPVEIAKLGLVLYLARWLEFRKTEVKSLENGLIPYVAILGIIVFLLGLQPDFGGILIVVPIAVAMYYVAGAKTSHLLTGFVVAAVFLVIVVSFVPYVNSRFHTFLDPSVDPTNRNAGWQIQQALIAVGSGGLFGQGFGRSVQKFGYLPEVQGDTIFAATAEEMGFFRIMVLLAAYAFIAYRGMMIAKGVQDRFASLVATGITTWFIWQTLVNIAVNLKIFPLTGITMPFLSYGGSSLMSLLIAAGILLNISRNVVTRETVVHRRRIGGAYTPQSRAY